MSRRTAFSLVEVVIAVGVFGVGVASILGLLGTMARQQAANADALVAHGLPDAVRVELRRVFVAAGSLDALATTIPVMSASMTPGLPLVASREGARVQALRFHAPASDVLASGEQYFLIELWRFDRPPLSFANGDTSLAVHARVSWPYAASVDGTTTPPASRETFTFNLAIER